MSEQAATQDLLLIGVEKPRRLLVGVEDAATILGIGQRTVWKLAKEGELPTVRIGNRTLWPVRELEKWVEDQLSVECLTPGTDNA